MTDTDRLIHAITAAEAGDTEAGRELLSMAAMQLRQTGALEPSLARYLADALDRAYRSPNEAATLLNIASKGNPSYRPPNNERKAAMSWAIDVAAEQGVIDRGDLSHLQAEARRIMAMKDESERMAQLIDWMDEFAEAKHAPTQTQLFELAADIFNRTLADAQAKGQRLNEKLATAKALKNVHDRRD